MDELFSKLIKDPYVRAEVLAGVRGGIHVIGAVLIAHGLADSGMVESFSGFATVAVAFWLSHLDVKGVDAKIKTASQ